MLSIRFALWIGRLAQVCKLPLRLSGHLRTPWISQASSPLVPFVTEGSFSVDASNSRLLPLELSRLATPQPFRRPHNTTSMRLSRCCPTACSGLQATPDFFRRNQRPLVATPGSQTPFDFSPASSSFSRRVPTIRFSSRLRSGAGPYRDFRSAPDGLLKFAGYLSAITEWVTATRSLLRSASYAGSDGLSRTWCGVYNKFRICSRTPPGTLRPDRQQFRQWTAPP